MGLPQTGPYTVGSVGSATSDGLVVRFRLKFGPVWVANHGQ